MGEVFVLSTPYHGLDVPKQEGASWPSFLRTSLLMNRDFRRKMAQSIVLLPDRQFLIERSLKGNIVEVEGLVIEVIFHAFPFPFLFCSWFFFYF